MSRKVAEDATVSFGKLATGLVVENAEGTDGDGGFVRSSASPDRDTLREKEAKKVRFRFDRGRERDEEG